MSTFEEAWAEVEGQCGVETMAHVRLGWDMREREESRRRTIGKSISLTGRTFDVDGYFDERKMVRYLGSAVERTDGMWQCLAQVSGGALCVVECSITFG